MKQDIFLGPAGIPIIAKGKSTIDGIEAVAELGLNAMEIEFVQQVYLNKNEAKEVGKLAKDLGVRLSIHAPYYINLCSKNESVVEASKKRILKCIEIGDSMEADIIAIHAAYYSGLTSELALEKIKKEFIDVIENAKPNVKLGIETMGKKSQFGSLEEIIRLHEIGVVPYIDWGHLFVRNNGKIDYGEIFDKLEKLKLEHINSHFEGVAKNKRGEFVDVHTPIGNPPFEPLAKEIVKRKIDITIISESPILEADSLRMKKIIEAV